MPIRPLQSQTSVQADKGANKIEREKRKRKTDRNTAIEI
jgi:hypothetical protein